MDAKEERRKRDRERYARMTDEEKQEKLKKRRDAYQQNKSKKYAQKAIVDSTPSKESIAMENQTYIATEQETGTTTLNLRQRKPVTQGERQTLLHRRNEEFSKRQRKTISVSSQQDTSVMNSDSNHTEPPKQPRVMINGKNLNFIQY
jgi:hypothetical protein